MFVDADDKLNKKIVEFLVAQVKPNTDSYGQTANVFAAIGVIYRKDFIKSKGLLLTTALSLRI